MRKKMRLKISELKQIIQEEAGKVLSEYYPGYDDDVADSKNKEREASRKAQQASYARQDQSKIEDQGLKDGESLDKTPAQSDNEFYMKGYLAGRSRSLEAAISRMEAKRKQYTGFKGFTRRSGPRNKNQPRSQTATQ
jgi:hypothetical protein